MEKMKVQTLVIGKGKYREFYGHIDDIGWCTSTMPIKLLNPDVTMDQVKKHSPENKNWKGVRLVEIKMKINEK
jgi:hypothetical protein